MHHDGDRESAIQVFSFLKKLTDLLPTAAPARPAFPAITSPASGDSVPAGPFTVRVSSNRPSEEHRVRLLDADTLVEVDNQLVTFDAVNKGFAVVTMPAAIASPAPAKDFIVECLATASGNYHRIVVTRPATIPPVLTLTVATNAPPPYAVGQTVRFTATPTGGTGAIVIMWGGTDVPFGTTADFVDVTFTAPTAGGSVSVFGHDSSVPALAAFSVFGPFVVNP